MYTFIFIEKLWLSSSALMQSGIKSFTSWTSMHRQDEHRKSKQSQWDFVERILEAKFVFAGMFICKLPVEQNSSEKSAQLFLLSHTLEYGTQPPIEHWNMSGPQAQIPGIHVCRQKFMSWFKWLSVIQAHSVGAHLKSDMQMVDWIRHDPSSHCCIVGPQIRE